MTPQIRTQRLVLRGWHESDKPFYAALCADPDVMRHFPSTLTAEQSNAMVDAMAARWQYNNFGLWAVERLDSTQFIGFVGLAAPSWQASCTPCVEVGWRLGKSHWGLGFAPEAARAVLRYGFDHVNLPNDEIVSFTTTANPNSRRVMSKIGMHHDAARDFDHPMTPGWAGQRHVLYSINRAQWRAAPPAGVAR